MSKEVEDKFIKVKGTKDKDFSYISLKYLSMIYKIDCDFSEGIEYCISIHSLGSTEHLNFDNPEDRDAYFEQLVGLLNVVEI